MDGAADVHLLGGHREGVAVGDLLRVLLLVEGHELHLAERRPVGELAAALRGDGGPAVVPPDDQVGAAGEGAAVHVAGVVEARQRDAVVAPVEAHVAAVEGVHRRR